MQMQTQMHRWSTVGLFAMLTACGGRQPLNPDPNVVTTEQALTADEAPCIVPTLCPGGTKAPSVLPGSCPDQMDPVCPDGTTNCCPTNGTGVYTAESGYAGIGDERLMITHFINNTTCTDTPQGECVTFNGQCIGAQGPSSCLSAPGRVTSATYMKQAYRVHSVGETDTEPVWRLTNTATGEPRSVKGADIENLTLDISFVTREAMIAPPRYTLSFETPKIFDKDGGHPVRTYNMRWSSSAGGLAKQYCIAPSIQENAFIRDSIVFQMGIEVDPGTGVTGRQKAKDLVTLSCRLGALATVYEWGYDYRPASTQDESPYFDAAIHMKRASYCGGADHYTIAGTPIEFADNIHSSKKQHPDRLEAKWDAKGATCINLNNRRHPELPFDGQCKNKEPLPACTEEVSAGLYLASGPRS
jgi:hypothetical protein